jgi:alpha-N-arabinofuranosidase
MATGSLDEAVAWVEYCNSDGDTYYANLRSKNGHDKPYNVKHWSLGNEVWSDGCETAFQWAKALKFTRPIY